MNCDYLERPGKPKLAYHYTPPQEKGKHLPVVCFLGGFKSDMAGTKATFLEASCKNRGQGYLRFDYSGHGRSEGAFKDGTISQWAQDAMDMIDHLELEHVLLVGSSMGGWISLLLLPRLGSIAKGMIGIAAAPDFTERLWAEELTEDQRRTIETQGYLEIPNEYSDEPYIFTKALFEDGKENTVLQGGHKLSAPITLIQGMKDPDVPWEVTAKIQKAYEGAEIDVSLVEDGDHRLSRPEDLDLLEREVISLSNFNEE